MSHSRPIISVITVTFNASATLPATLKSVARQEGCTPGIDYEYIVMDGASSDGTPEIAQKAPIEAMTVFSEPDSGIYDAMNKAMDRAQGEYYMFLNAGDAFHSPTTLRTILDAIKNHDRPGVVYGQTVLVDAERRYIGPRHLTAPENLTYHSFTDGMLVCHQAFIALVRIAPRYDLRYKFSADYEWCIQVLQHSRHNVYIPDVIVDYLDEGLTTANRYASLRERFRIMCYYFGTIPTVLRHLKFILRFITARGNEKKRRRS
ncbi:MAG: glycosyltransferase [Muribaculaceae bacterium]|nr:glycosyltransferase [Muribaculaceae bacterium]